MAQDRRSPPAGADSGFLGERLRRLRQQLGLSLRGLAKKVGVRATALHYWESGQRNPSYEHLQAFAEALALAGTEVIAGSRLKCHPAAAAGVLDPLTTAAPNDHRLTCPE